MSDINEVARERITKSRVTLMLDMPFFGVLALGMKLIRKEEVGTAGTDGINLYYNPEFIESLTDAELNWVIVHELLHPVLGHLWRKNDRVHEPWNVACDYALHNIMHDYIKHNAGIKDKLRMPKNCLYDEKYADMSAEEIYDTFKIINIMWTLRDGEGELLGNHDMWEDVSKEEKEEWQKRIVEAGIMARNSGTLSGKLGRLVDNIVKPKKDWRIILNEFVETEVTDYSFNPPDKRFSEFDFFMPDFNEEDEVIKNILFLVDTSGSVGVKELEEFYGELLGAVNQFRNRLAGKLGFFDGQCHGLTDFDDIEGIKAILPKGGGGTSFINALQYVSDNVDVTEIAGIVMFTDGYAKFPEESIARGVPVLWAISKTSEVVAPWGVTISLKE